MISIIELDDNKSFLLCDLDNDTEKQNKIIEMKEEIHSTLEGNNIGSIYSYNTNSNRYEITTLLVANTGYLVKSTIDNNTVTGKFA